VRSRFHPVDWNEMIPLPTGRIALVIGDVQGHDVRAAGLMGQLRIALRAYASEGLADTLVQAVHGPGSHYTTGPLADRRENDIAVLMVSEMVTNVLVHTDANALLVAEVSRRRGRRTAVRRDGGCASRSRTRATSCRTGGDPARWRRRGAG
jgi:hypothetical protein